MPARRVGRRLQQISREQMQHNAAMNTQMTERFNVAGALLVKLFGDDEREVSAFRTHAAGVRDAGIRQALYGRVFFVALGLVGAIGAAAIYGVGAHLVVSGNITTGTLVALAALVARIYGPLTALTNTRVDLMTSMVSFERVFEVLDAPEPIVERPGAVDLPEAPDGRPAGRVTFDHVRFRYPPAAETSIVSMEQRAPETDPDHDVLGDIHLDIAPGETRGPRRRVGRRQVDDGVAHPAPLRRHRRRRPHRRPRRPRPDVHGRCGPRSASSARTRTCSTCRSARTCATRSRRPRRTRSSRPPRGRGSTT